MLQRTLGQDRLSFRQGLNFRLLGPCPSKVIPIVTDITIHHLGFPSSSDGKESACNEGNLGSIPGLGRFPVVGMATHSNILAWRIPMDSGAWWATACRVPKSWTRLSD